MIKRGRLKIISQAALRLWEIWRFRWVMTQAAFARLYYGMVWNHSVTTKNMCMATACLGRKAAMAEAELLLQVAPSRWLICWKLVILLDI